MNRRTHMAVLGRLAALMPLMTTVNAADTPSASPVRRVTATAMDALADGLKPSVRQPVLFVGHGSPLNVLPGNTWRMQWEQLGEEVQKRAEPPQLILCVSAHWLTRGGWFFTGMEKPRTIHDFGGFPPALYDMQYPAPGAPAAARAMARALQPAVQRGVRVGVDKSEWGLDHGAWSVLLPMFEQANIPVVQLSMDYSRPLNEHFALGQQLQRWRERGVMIVGSGNIVHNLRVMERSAAPNQAFEWAAEFDAHIHTLLRKGDTAGLQAVQTLGSLMHMAHPTHDHYLPLLYAAGAVLPGEEPRFFNTGFQAGSISMRSVMWG